MARFLSSALILIFLAPTASSRKTRNGHRLLASGPDCKAIGVFGYGITGAGENGCTPSTTLSHGSVCAIVCDEGKGWTASNSHTNEAEYKCIKGNEVAISDPLLICKPANFCAKIELGVGVTGGQSDPCEQDMVLNFAEDPSCKVECGEGYYGGEGEYTCGIEGGKASTSLECKLGEAPPDLPWYLNTAVSLKIMKQKAAEDIVKAEKMKDELEKAQAAKNARSS